MSSRKPSIYKAPLRYFFAVIFGFCVDFSIYAALVSINTSVYFANFTGFCVGMIINLILIRTLVFPDNRFRLRADLPLTFVVNGLMFGLSTGLLQLFVDVLSITPYWAKLFANGTTFVLNYMARAIFFRKK